MKSIKLKRVIPMNIQLFTEGGDGGSGSEGGQGASGVGDGGDPQPITFATQAELDSALDKHTTKALATARAKWESESQQAIEAAKTEAQRLAGLTAEQKELEEQRQQEETIAKREADITRRELRAQSLEQLAEKELPKELIDVVVLTDADACIKSIEAIEKSFRAAVEDGVNKRLAESANPPASGGAGGGGSEKGAMGKRLAEQNAKQQKESNFF